MLAVNQAPSGTDRTGANALDVNEDATYTFAAADFGFSDSDGDAFAGVVFTTLPAGTLTANGTPVTPGSFVAAAVITGNLLRFTPASQRQRHEPDQLPVPGA